MRQLGTASIHSYRWDLVFLHGSLLADPSPGVSALASEAARLLDDVRAERALYERRAPRTFEAVKQWLRRSARSRAGGAAAEFEHRREPSRRRRSEIEGIGRS